MVMHSEARHVRRDGMANHVNEAVIVLLNKRRRDEVDVELGPAPACIRIRIIVHATITYSLLAALR